jgi:hypothetical protein
MVLAVNVPRRRRRRLHGEGKGAHTRRRADGLDGAAARPVTAAAFGAKKLPRAFPHADGKRCTTLRW